MAELVACIKLCNRLCAIGQEIAAKDLCHLVNIVIAGDPEALGQWMIEGKKFGRGDWLGRHSGKKPVGQAGIAVGERNAQGHGDHRLRVMSM